MAKVQLVVLMLFAAEMIMIMCIGKAIGYRKRVIRRRRRAQLGPGSAHR